MNESMETISNEIKAKVFAQYLGQKCYRGGTPDEKLISVDIENNAYGFSDGDVFSGKYTTELKLILKPLSSISDEHLYQCLTICFGEDWDKGETETFKRTWFEVLKTELVDGFGSVQMNIKPYFSQVWQIKDFLISQGYDMENHLLGGKTLHECNLCIYE